MARKIGLNGKEFTVTVVSDVDDMIKGLSDTDTLDSGHGMLFDFDKPQEVTMNMVKMKYPLDMIFIDGEGEVIAVESMEPGDNYVTKKGVKYVLEVNKGEGKGLIPDKKVVKEDKGAVEKKELGGNFLVSTEYLPQNMTAKFKSGGKIGIKEDIVKARPGMMQVLDDKGRVLMNIKGGERIFSIKHTEKLIEYAKKVENGEAPPEELGSLIKEILHIQDTQEPEYV